ncbi:WD40 repeat domain-containing protein [Chloroflexota bacterium]
MLNKHEKAVQAINISPEVTWVATGSNDKKVRRWRLDSSDPTTEPVQLAGHTGNLLAVAFSPDGE